MEQVDWRRLLKMRWEMPLPCEAHDISGILSPYSGFNYAIHGRIGNPEWLPNMGEERLISGQHKEGISGAKPHIVNKFDPVIQ